MLIFEIHIMLDGVRKNIRRFTMETTGTASRPSFRVLHRTILEWIHHSEFSIFLEGASENLTFCGTQRGFDNALFHHPFNSVGSSSRLPLRFFVFSNHASSKPLRRERKIHVRPVVMIKTEDGFFNPRPVLAMEDCHDPSRLPLRRATVNWGMCEFDAESQSEIFVQTTEIVFSG
ncbi:hypothetical protein BV898_10746 [Hypsibius exemplaris]|uniref:Uncharacterized protein n=1 Tax=Hypsibius exemplaris TaxID=2072580 RepID=A0A1W0WIU3_HYPEX|nr:hypothetical protein BV898_10746 [Hypsibius exemplaris]